MRTNYLATLVTSQNCTKMLFRNLTFFVQFICFGIKPKKVFAFSSNFNWATFVIKSSFWLFFEQLWPTFWAISGKSPATCGKPLENLFDRLNHYNMNRKCPELNEISPHFIHDIKTKGNDVIDVNVFHFKLMRFHFKKTYIFILIPLLACQW